MGAALIVALEQQEQRSKVAFPERNGNRPGAAACIEPGSRPATRGHEGLELVRILEATSESLNNRGVPVFCGTSLRGAPSARNMSHYCAT
jgi:hypothetical protein